MSVAEDRMYQLMLKMGKSDDSPGDTEESTVGVQPDAHPDPSEEGQKEEGTINARWGQEDHKPEEAKHGPQHYSNAVLDEFVRGRENFLQRHFDTYGTSGDTNRKVLGQQLEHARTGDYDSSSAMYSEQSSSGSSEKRPAAVDTVLDKTKRALNKY